MSERDMTREEFKAWMFQEADLALAEFLQNMPWPMKKSIAPVADLVPDLFRVAFACGVHAAGKINIQRRPDA
jgi:hypothetical protein